MPFCERVPSFSRAWEARGDAGEQDGQEPCHTALQAGPVGSGAGHPCCRGLSTLPAQEWLEGSSSAGAGQGGYVCPAAGRRSLAC